MTRSYERERGTAVSEAIWTATYLPLRRPR